jgi:hypothetical protein
MKRNIFNFKEHSLDRSEMKNIKGGKDGDNTGGICLISSSCTLHIRQFNQNFTGSCYYQLLGRCYCSVTVGGQVYTTDENTVSMCVVYP